MQGYWFFSAIMIYREVAGKNSPVYEIQPVAALAPPAVEQCTIDIEPAVDQCTIDIETINNELLNNGKPYNESRLI